MNIELVPFMLNGSDGLEAAFDEMAKSKTSAVIMQPSLPHALTARLALKHRLPSFSPNPLFPGSGGLMAYSADYDALYRDTASLVDKVLKGRNPGELPVQMPSKFWLAINLKTAKAIGVTVPGHDADPRRRGDRVGAPAASWCDPAGGSPAQVRSSASLVASVASPLATVAAKRTQRLPGVWD